MRAALRVLGLLILLITIGVWLAMGGTLGWTKTTVESWETDPVTGIEHVTNIERFVPGIEFLALGIGGAAVIFGASFLVRKSTS
jgi:hypothetical protein